MPSPARSLTAPTYRSVSFGRIALGALCWTLTGCHPAAPEPNRSSGIEASPVTVAVVTNAVWDRSVPIIGTLYPKDEATIGAQVEGAVEQTLVDFGDRIRLHQELAVIDMKSYQAQSDQAVGNLAKAEANLANSRLNFARVSKLRTTGIASESDFDQAQAQADQWAAEVKATRGAWAVAQLNLERSRVTAPFDGAIAQRIVGRGDFVRLGSPLFMAVNDSVLKFIFQVPEKYASFVRKELPVSFNVDNYPGETFAGRVYLISPAVTLSSRAFFVGALVTTPPFVSKPTPLPEAGLFWNGVFRCPWCRSKRWSNSPVSPKSMSSRTAKPTAEPFRSIASRTAFRKWSKD